MNSKEYLEAKKYNKALRETARQKRNRQNATFKDLRDFLNEKAPFPKKDPLTPLHPETIEFLKKHGS